jgi:hypothetical protein
MLPNLSAPLLVCLLLASAALPGNAQTPPAEGLTVTPSGMRVNSRFIPTTDSAAVDGLRLISPDTPAPRPQVPTFSGDRQVIALASALGGQLSLVYGKETVGSNLDPYTRQTVTLPDNSLDRIVLRGLDRTVARSFPDSERVFMRLNPVLLDDVSGPQREAVALQRLIEELRGWPQRQQWHRIVVLVPHYRGFERNGLGSKLNGIGLYAPPETNQTEFDVSEVDGSPSPTRRSQYLAIFYYALLVVLDAKTLQVIESQPWLIDEKLHDRNSASLRAATSIKMDVLAERIEQFAEKASTTALARTLGGTVTPGALSVPGNRSQSDLPPTPR